MTPAPPKGHADVPLISFSAAEAAERLKQNRLSRWPDGRKDRTRLGGIAQVGFEPSFVFEPGESLFTMGSCFARNIERRLADAGFHLPTLSLSLPEEERASDTVNDLLNKYTPPSMLNELRWALEPGAEFPEAAFLRVRRGQWHDPHLAGNVALAPLERVAERRAMVTDIYRQIPKCRVIVITLGLAEAWFDQELGIYLNEAPPARVRETGSRFRVDILSVPEILESLEGIHAVLERYGHPDFRILLTVSPVPFKATYSGRDAITANSYSKSALRAAAEAFVLSHPRVDYFPSYEIVTQTPRTAAFIQDNRHVTDSVVTEIVKRVIEAYSPAGEDEPTSHPGKSKELTKFLKDENYPAALRLLRHLGRWGRFGRVGWTEAEYHFIVGKTLARSGAHAEAQIALTRSVHLNPLDASAQYNLGIILNKLQRPLDAETHILRAVELAPGSLDMRLRLARQLAANGKREGANAQLEIAQRQHPAVEETLKVARDLGFDLLAIRSAAANARQHHG
jgi:tetratricopeptide (TPR) repeat protein